jgi:myo-inositol-1-phosphate synthase
VAFDVDDEKVGKSLDEAIFAGQNNTLRFAEVPKLEARVLPAPVLDGVGRHYNQRISTVDGDPTDVPKALRDSRTDVVVNYLPVGSKEATQWWAARSLEAGCAFVNCIPEFIACDQVWQKRFRHAKLPLIGDDVKSQFGATIVHRVLARLLASRGIKLERTYQLNFGGNMDFFSMLDSERLTTKRASKRNSVQAEIPHAIEPRNIHISPSDYVEWLDDRKFCYIRIEGTAFGGAPLNLELKLEVWDSPNSAGVVIDSVRFAKLAKDHGCGGAINPVCSVYMKSPPSQVDDEEAVEDLERWLSETAGNAAGRVSNVPKS